jgi:hypothetical protein
MTEATFSSEEVKTAIKKSVKAKATKAVFVKNKPFNGDKLIKKMIDARYERQHSIAFAAAAVNISKSGWQKIEATGTCTPETLGSICNYLQLPVQFFFS